MNRLLKLQFFRFFKDKQSIIMMAVTFGYCLLSSLLFGFLFSVSTAEGTTYFASSLSIILASFSPIAVATILFPIIMIVFFVRESNYGTMRNQIVSGYSKGMIYVADALFILIVGVAFILVYQLLQLGLMSALGLPLFIDSAYQAVSLSAAASNFNTNWGPFLIKYLTGWLTYILLLSLLTFGILVFKNVPLPLLLSIVLPLVGYYAALIISTIVFTNSYSQSDDPAVIIASLNTGRTILEFFPSYQLLTISDFIGMTSFIGVVGSEKYLFTTDLPFILKSIFVNLGFAAAFYVGGYFIFIHRDMK